MINQQNLIKSSKNLIESSRIFIICSLYGGSGYYLLNSLFDSHPKLFTIPFSPQHTNVEPDHFSRLNSKEDAISLLNKNEFLFDTGINANENNPLNGLGPNRDESLVMDRRKFTCYLTAILNVVEFNPKNLTLALIMSYNFAKGNFPETNSFIIPAHDIGIAKGFRNSFKNGKIIAIARHPVSCYRSFCRSNVRKFGLSHYHSGRTQQLLYHQPSSLESLEEYLRIMQEYREEIGVIILEELHANPEQSMRAVARFMDVDFHPSLLESTMGGKLFWGSLNTVVQGFSKTLHRNVDTKFTGRNDAFAIMNMTLKLQNRLGYTNLEDLTLSKKLIAKLPSYRYYVDRFKLCFDTIKKSASLAEIMRASSKGLKDIFHYTKIRLGFDNHRIEDMAAMDREIDHSRLIVINPIQPDSIEIDSSLSGSAKD